MFHGQLLAIGITEIAAQPLQNVSEVDAVAGVGLTGDRYALLQGSFQKPTDTLPMHVTLIEVETLEAAQRDYGIEITHLMTRRNLLTRGVPLNHLVGQSFQIGDVLMRGVELCEPCRHLQKLTCKEIHQPLVHRGGLRAEIVRGGRLRVGESVRIA